MKATARGNTAVNVALPCWTADDHFWGWRATRDFTFMSDTARGILLAGLSDHAVGETINLGSGGEYTINQLAQEIAHVIGKSNAQIIHDKPRPGDVRRLLVDTSQARELLGFIPK